MDKPNNDITRLRQEYANRASCLKDTGEYSHFNSMNLFIRQHRERHLLELLKANGLYPLSGKDILEVGCGEGGTLLDFMAYGADPSRLFGIDLLYNRLTLAHHRLPKSIIINADGQKLPFTSGKFDLVLQFTAFSSILDKHIKASMANEILRVLRPGGVILWYDFWWNPTNPNTAGIKPSEIKQLFPGCQHTFRKITLAPPIARTIVPFSQLLALFLESLQIFNSHYLGIIQKQGI